MEKLTSMADGLRASVIFSWWGEGILPIYDTVRLCSKMHYD